jgi:flavin reductase (DIM6/NTAB) family NADH-FMN oxidoreductase RutF
MIAIDPAAQTEKENYKLLIGSIIPRPIAFVTTLSQDGILNAAPFSYFSIVSSSPPRISIAVQRKQGVMKDTARNAIDTGSFVVHTVDETNVELVNQTAANLPPDESEVDLAKLTSVPSDIVAVPGLREAKIRMECQLEQAILLDDVEGQPTTDLLIARVVRFHLAEEVYEDGYILAEQLNPASRLAGNYYALLGRQFEIKRPE